MRKILFCLMAMCMLVSCNVNNTKEEQQEEQTVELATPFNFIEPQDIECGNFYTIFQTLGQDYGLARSFEAPNLAVVVTDNICYDGLEVIATDSTEFRIIGTYEYQSLDSLYRTVPVLRLYNKQME